MENQPAGKNKYLVRILHGIVYTGLIITVFVQYRQNTELKRELNKTTLSEESKSGNIIKEKPPGLKTVKPPLKISGISEEDISDKEKIKRLESRIVDMQVWQDYLEESLEKQKQEDDKNIEMQQSFTRSVISSRIDGFAEDAGLSQDIKTKLFNLLFEKEMELDDLFSGDVPQEARKKEIEYIEQKYDELISDLLSDKYFAYKEYLKSQWARQYITDFNDSMLNSIPLEKQQEQKLITAIYNETQNFKDIQNEKMQALYGEKLSYSEQMQEELEMQKALRDRYIESAKTILSEPQLQKFKKYLDAEILQEEILVNRVKSQSVDDD